MKIALTEKIEKKRRIEKKDKPKVLPEYIQYDSYFMESSVSHAILIIFSILYCINLF